MVRASASALGSHRPSTLVQHLSAGPLRLSLLSGARFLMHKHSAVKWPAFGPSVRTPMRPLLACSNAKKPCMDLIPLFHHTACDTKLNVSMSFGGPSWPISNADLSLGTNTDGMCVGAIFDIEQGTNISPSSGVPSWIVGDTFLVRFHLLTTHISPALTWLLKQT